MRFFHSATDDTFWVAHAADLDRVIAAGARLEVLPSGEVRDAAWDVDLASRGEPLAGGLAVPERLGGGFVFWSRARVFRAAAFTGALDPLALGVGGDVHVRGVRAGLASVLVLTAAGPRELRPGSDRLTALREPALLDLAAVSATRAARLDVFGRLLATHDGGARWNDLSPVAGIAVQRIAQGEAELSVHTWLGHYVLTPADGLEFEDGSRAGDYDAPRTFQTAWKNTRATQRDNLPWVLHDAPLLESVVSAGAPVGDGTAFGMAQNAALRVDLATGKLVSVSTDWIPSGLQCQPLGAPDGVLFACVWESWQGYGGYVLRSVGGAPPVVEKAFSDDGGFLADDDGALGYAGSCRAEPRFIDFSSRGRSDGEPVPPVFCVRRAPGEWVEHRVDLAPGETLAAWVPHRDGTATAIVLPDLPLPPPVGAPRATVEAGVRVVRLHREIPGWRISGWPLRSSASWQSGSLDRRFHARADGSIDAWLAPTDDDTGVLARGVTIDPAGIPVAHALPPGVIATIAGGRFALALTQKGDLYETTDHGRTFQPVGRSPVPVSSPASGSCTALGCGLGAVVRLGWGETSALAPRVSTEPYPPPAPPPLPRLVCSPRGAPVPILAPAWPTGTRQTLNTPWGEPLELFHDTPALDAAVFPKAPPAPPPAPSTSAPAPAPSGARPLAKGAKPPRPSPAVLRTQTLVVHPPLAPNAPARHINATDASFDVQRQRLVVPLLSPSGDVDLLAYGEPNDLLVAGDKITALSSYEGRRYYYGGRGDWDFTGLTSSGGRALVLGEARRRLTLEDHGPGPPTLPAFLGLGREHLVRPLSLGRRDDGALGVLVLDGAAPETAAVAPLDRAAAAVSPPTLLAPWSTVVTADDPRCKKGEGPPAYRALVLLDPSLWLTLDQAALPGMTLGIRGIALVRWSAARVCLEALDAMVSDPGRRRGEVERLWRLVVRWGEGKERGAVLRAPDTREELSCTVEAAEGK